MSEKNKRYKIEIFDKDDKKLVEVIAYDVSESRLYCCDKSMRLKAPVKMNENPLTIMNVLECTKCGKYRKEILTLGDKK